MKKHLRRSSGNRGQTLAEYALILAFISMLAVAEMISLRQNIKGACNAVNGRLAFAQTNH